MSRFDSLYSTESLMNFETRSNISSKFNFQIPGLKGNVTVAISRKNRDFALAPAFIDGFTYIFIRFLGIVISRASLTFRLLGSRSR